MNIPQSINIIRNRIDACDTLIDYVLDDIPHSRQQPILGELRQMKGNFENDLLSFREEISEVAQ